MLYENLYEADLRNSTKLLRCVPAAVKADSINKIFVVNMRCAIVGRERIDTDSIHFG